MVISHRYFLPTPLLVVLLVLATGGPACASIARFLDLDPANAEYEVDCVFRMVGNKDNNKRVAYLMARIDGDGLDEFITGTGSKFFGWDSEDGSIKPRWQVNLDPGYQVQGRILQLGVPADFNGDGIEEIYTTVRAVDRSEWKFVVLDPAKEAVTLTRNLPLGLDRRGDGIWDGTYLVVGTVADADGQGRPGVVLQVSVEYDANPRGIVVLDPLTGEKIWAWECGPNPDIDAPVVFDLDGDGNNEIVLFGHSPDNLGGHQINGHSDDESLVFVLNSQGQLQWKTRLGGTFFAGSTYPVDLDNDGLLEVLVLTRNNAVNTTNRLLVLDGATGTEICHVRGNARFLGVAAVPGPRPGSAWVYAGSDEGTIDRFLYENRSLQRDLRALEDEPRCVVVGAVDILPDPGPEILIDVGNGGRFAVLNREFETKAVFVDDLAWEKRNPVVWKRVGGRSSLVLGYPKGHWVLDFNKRPFSMWATMRIPLMLLGAIILVVAIYSLGRRSGARAAHQHSAVAEGNWTMDRDILYGIWRQLDDVRHEKIMTANRGLSRLVWLLEAYASDLGGEEKIRKRVDQLMIDYMDSVQPRLHGLLLKARSQGFELETVDATMKALTLLTGRLERLVTSQMTVAAVAAETDTMKRELLLVEGGFLEIWKALREGFATDPRRMVEAMLVVRESEFRRLGIGIEFQQDRLSQDHRCLIDSGDLRYVLDNLIENAARAMAESSSRRLVIGIACDQTECTLSVSDTGPGVPEALGDRIFSGRYSSRQGGGSGLFRSREILQRWGGEIVVAPAGLAGGATFVIHLRALRKASPALVEDTGA